MFESSVNSYDSQTSILSDTAFAEFESSVNSYDSQTLFSAIAVFSAFESSVNSYDSQTFPNVNINERGLRVV